MLQTKQLRVRSGDKDTDQEAADHNHFAHVLIKLLINQEVADKMAPSSLRRDPTLQDQQTEREPAFKRQLRQPQQRASRFLNKTSARWPLFLLITAELLIESGAASNKSLAATISNWPSGALNGPKLTTVHLQSRSQDKTVINSSTARTTPRTGECFDRLQTPMTRDSN